MYLLVLLSLFLHLLSTPVSAQVMQSPNYQLQNGSFDFEDSSQTNSPNEEASPISGLSPEQQKQFETYGYTIVNSATQETEPSVDFSQTALSFEDLSVNPIQTKEIQLNLANQGTKEYVLYLIKESPFLSPQGDVIPNTLCSEHGNMCTATQAQDWSSPTAYGLGFQIAGRNKPIDFMGDNYYRSFLNNNLPTKITTYNSQSTSNATTLRFKLALPPDKTESSYLTTVSLFFIPQP